MKKLISILLMLALLCAPAGALAAKGDAVFGRDMYETYDDGIYGACVMGDGVYMYGSSHVYTWKIGEADLTALDLEMPESGENQSYSIARIFSDGETLYGMVTLYESGENKYSLKRLELREIELADGKARLGEPRELDATNMTVDYGNGPNLFQINDLCCIGDRAFMYVYDDMGNSKVYAMNLADGAGSYLDVEQPVQITPYADGQLLIETYDYSASKCELILYDPESESYTPACAPLEPSVLGDGYGALRGLAYSRESDRLFFLSDGYIKAAKDFDIENAEAVAELSMSSYSDASGLLLPGDYYVYSTYDATTVRATNAEELPETRLTVQNAGYSRAVTDSYYNFLNTRGDVAVILSQDYVQDSKIIESMMNRDSGTDIYVMSVQSQAYDALFGRGYMAELEDETIRAAVEGMYPGIRAVLERDGEIVAVPIGLYGWTVGLNAEGFEKIGVSLDEVPDNWPEFLDFLAELPDKLPEDGKVRIFEEYWTQEDLRLTMLTNILTTYSNAIAAEGRDPSYDTPELRNALEKLVALDFAALGVKASEEEEDAGMGGVSISRTIYVGGAPEERTYTLIEPSTGCTLGNFYNESVPHLLSIAPGETAQLPVDLNVAFVNPFSEHVEIATEFLAEIVRNLETDAIYNLSDAQNEPVRNRYYEENMQNMQKTLDEARALLEEAEPVDRPMLEENVAQIEQSMEEMEGYSWDISAEALEWYRAHAENLFVQRYNYMYSSDDAGIFDLYQQFRENKIDVTTFLKTLDQKVRMMALEGN